MKILPQVLGSVMVIAITSYPVYSHIPTIPSGQIPFHQLTLAQTQTVQVTLTSQAEITLKNKRMKLGRLTNVDQQKRNFTITRGGQSEIIPITQILKVTFLDLVGGKWKPLAPPKGEQRTWLGVSLENLKIHKSGAEVSLPIDVDPKISREQDYVYVIKELTFPATNKMDMLVYVSK